MAGSSLQSVDMTAPGPARRPLDSPHPRPAERGRWRWRTAFAAVVSSAVVAGLAVAGPPVAGPAHAGPDAADPGSPHDPVVEEQVWLELAAGGETDFWVYLSGEPELDPASGIDDRAAQGRFVHERLMTTAHDSQAGLIALLDVAGVDYEPFWVANTVRVTGDEQLLEQILTLPEVVRVTADREYRIQQPEPGEDHPSVAGVEWGLDRINGPQVWDELGATGEGIVVGSIDSGAQFDHPALVEQYRGNLGNGEFDHHYDWHDPSRVCGDPSLAPCDNTGHGTHVTGTMVGDDGGDNRIGVAPDAQWVAAKGCETTTCSQAALLSSAQFMLAPTNLNNENPDPSLRPHVVNNSWGGSASTDPWFRPMVQAWVAAGIFPQFANGNTLFGTAPCGSASNPGNLPESYSAGAFDIDGDIADLSNRGPSAWGSDQVKPNLAAPGIGVRSAVPGDGYDSKSGTSMASPHVAGTVALMWSAAQPLHREIDATRALLDRTAIDTEDLTCDGEPGNNNVWGQGRLDAYAAVSQAPRGPAGQLEGVVRDAADGEPVPGATVEISGPVARERTTGPDGTFSLTLPVGGYEVSASAFGYEPDTTPGVTVIEDEVTELTLTLSRAPSATVAGDVRDANDDAPVAGAQVRARLDGVVVRQATTGDDGRYAFGLPLGTYDIEVTRTLYSPESARVTLDTAGAEVPVDFALRTPHITVAPPSIETTLPPGAQETYDLTLDNHGSADGAFQVHASSLPWLSVDPSSGTLQPGESTAVSLRLDATWLAPGEYPVALEVTSNSARQRAVEVPVRVTVPEVTAIEVDPSTVQLRPGETQQHHAVAELADGTSLDVTDWARWSSDNEDVVTVDETGLATAVGGIFATVTVTLSGVSDTASYRVTGRPVDPWDPRDRHRPGPPVDEPTWQAEFFGPGVDGDHVLATTVWDDGDGPALYAAGTFRTAGGHRVDHIARWDGERWSPLAGSHGTGVNGTVNTLHVYDGALIVGGQFTEAGGVPASYVARWDGQEWSALTGPLGSRGVSGQVFALLAYEGTLLVGGVFAEAGRVEVNRVARWDGTGWSPLTSPDGSVGVDGPSVTELVEYRGNVIAGGFFAQAGGVDVDHLARWDGERWSALTGPSGFGVDSTINALAVYDDELIIGGGFTQAGGVAVNRLARWDGDRWRPLGQGVGGSFGASVYALTVHAGGLYAGGFFPLAGGAPADHVARWDGESWHPLAEGVTRTVRTLAGYGDAVVAGGRFVRASGVLVNHLATWDGDGWAALAGTGATGMPGTVAATTTFRGELVAAGSFGYAGDVVANNVARWDGDSWSALTGPEGTGVVGQVDALAVYDDSLIVAGLFSTAGGVPANRVARWDGEQWSAVGAGMSGRVYALAVHDGYLVAGGAFREADGVTVNRIARWDGESWSAMAGPDGVGMGSGFLRTVSALAVHDGDLIAGGQFSEAGGVTVNNVARWDGQAWSALSTDSGTGVDDWVHALAVHDGDLIVGGRLTTAGGVPAHRVARWDGAGWSALGDGMDNHVRALTVLDGRLIAGGEFHRAGAETVHHVAAWDGTAWSALPGPAGIGTDAAVLTLDTQPRADDPPVLVAGGEFTAAGGVAAWGLARYGHS